MIRALCLLGLFLLAGPLAAQEHELPALTGRVVDRAELLDAQTEARLTSLLAGHEQRSGGEGTSEAHHSLIRHAMRSRSARVTGWAKGSPRA